MQQTLRPSALVPRGFVVESAVCDGATTLITVRHNPTRIHPGWRRISGITSFCHFSLNSSSLHDGTNHRRRIVIIVGNPPQTSLSKINDN